MSAAALRTAVLARVGALVASLETTVEVVDDPLRKVEDLPNGPYVVVDLAGASDHPVASSASSVAYDGRGAVVLDAWWPPGEGVGWFDDVDDAIRAHFSGVDDLGASYDLIDPDPTAVEVDGMIRRRWRVHYTRTAVRTRSN